MIGGINSEQDFYVFLTGKEIELLNTIKTPLRGILIDFVDELHYPLELSVNDAKTARGLRKHYLHDIVIEGFEERTSYRMFVSKDYFKKLKATGDIGGRYGYGKVDILEISRAENDEEHKNRLKYIKRRCPIVPGNFGENIA